MKSKHKNKGKLTKEAKDLVRKGRKASARKRLGKTNEVGQHSAYMSDVMRQFKKSFKKK